MAKTSTNYYEIIKQQVLELMQSDDTTNICVVGGGYCGKTYLYDDLIQTSKNNSIKLKKLWYIYDSWQINFSRIEFNTQCNEDTSNILVITRPKNANYFDSLGYKMIFIEDKMWE